MAEQIDTTFVPTHRDHDTGKEERRQNHAELVVGVRVDELPAGEAQRLAGEVSDVDKRHGRGKFYPLTMDKDGNLRVVLPSSTKVEVSELEVLSEMLEVVKECRDLLMQIAPGS